MRIVAFDLSLTSTGYATPEKTGVIKTEQDGMRRLLTIRNRVIDLINGAFVDRFQNDPDFGSLPLIVLEGYSFNSRASQAHSLGELGGVIRCTLFEKHVKYVDISPASLKKYATGKGNAGKEEVLASAIRRLGYAGHNNNEADALWLREMALDHYNATSRVPAAHREALVKIEWPKIDAPKPAQPALL